MPLFDKYAFYAYNITMPTIKTINNIKFYIYLNEGPRAHIHVKIAEYEIQVWLDDMSLKKGCRDQKIQAKLMGLVVVNREELIAGWKQYFGE